MLVGATIARAAWDKLVAAYASGSRPYICELKSQLHTLLRDNVSIESYVQKTKGMADKLATLHHPVPNDNLIEFVLAGLGPFYRPFTRDKALTVIVPTTQYTQSSFSTTRGRGRGRGRGHSSNHNFQSSQNHGSHNYAHKNSTSSQASDMSAIICHNCEGKGHIASVYPSPKSNIRNKVSGQPISNLARTPSPQNWLIGSGTTHHLTANLENLGIHSEYQGPEEVTISNGSKISISHIGKSSVVISGKKNRS
uniref:Uncharacterized protein n=1 Tax=Solanum lycopersicum TaxID=4081 RepID=A0A3Q7I1U8_SOLLC